MRININITASHPWPMSQCYILQEDGMVMTGSGVMTSSRLKVGYGEKWGHSPEEVLREYQWSISVTLKTTVIIDLNYYFLCQ